VLGAGTFPSCSLASVTTVCATSCTSSLSLACSAPEHLQTCTANADCTGATTGYDTCCTIQGYHACLPSALNGLGGVTCP
jgi:hypothetical protein